MAKTKKKEDPKDIENNSHEEYTPEGAPKKRWEIPLVWHPSFFDIMDELETDAEKVNFVNAIKWYNRYKELPEGTLYVVKVAMKGIMPIIDKNRSKYIAQVNNGKQGGRPKKEESTTETQQNPTKPNETININNNINNNNDINNDIDINKDININNDIDMFDNNKLLSHTHKEIKNKESVCVDEEKNNFKSYSCHLNRVYKDSLGECADCKKRFSCKIKDISDDPDLYNAKKRAKAIMNKEIIEADNDFSSKEKKELAPAKWVTKGEDY